MASMLLHEALKDEHALRGGRACPCCTTVGRRRTASGRSRTRRASVRRQRRIEERNWRDEWS